MLKQWLLGRKRYSSTHVHFLDPALIGPLGDKYVVYRTNPIFADDSLWITDTDDKIPPLSAIVAPHEPKLHVQAWCSLVCPNHLTTCCSCKPAWIYCDNCHPPVRYHAHHPSPDVVPLSTKKEIFSHIPDIALSPRNLPTMDGHHYYHIIGPPVLEDHEVRTSLKPAFLMPQNNSVNSSNNNRENASENPPVLHIYINSEFVSGIAVTGSKSLVNQNFGTSNRGQNVSIQIDQINLDVSTETDSLDSLRIDEGMFDQSSGDRSSDVIVSGSQSVQEGISPTGTKRLLMDSEVAYEAVRDLYEKLSNNRQRQVVTQAMSGTQRTKVIREYVQNTYETLTKHVKGHYGKLVDDQLKRPPLYLVPKGSIPRGRPLPEPMEGSDVVLQDSKKNSLRVLTGSKIEFEKRHQDHLPGRDQSKSTEIDRIVPDVAYEVATSDQFITRRDPKYGDQVVQTNNMVPKEQKVPRFYDELRKRFKQKNYRDACKIIITTLVGLTAFGIITALSLSINRK